MMKNSLLLPFAVALLLPPGRAVAQKNQWFGVTHESSAGTKHVPAAVFLGGNGDYVVAWNNNISGNLWKTYYRRFDRLGNPLDVAEKSIQNASPTFNGLDVASVTNGDFIVVWEQSGTNDIMAQYIRSDGTAEGSPVKLDDSPDCSKMENPRLALYSSPPNPEQVTGILCWVDVRHGCDSTDNDTVFLRFFSFNTNDSDPLSRVVFQNGSVQADSMEIASGNLDLDSQVDVSPDGTVIVAWRHSPSGGEHAVLYSTYDLRGDTLTYMGVVDSTLAGAKDLSISSFSDNGYVIAWRAKDDDGYDKVFARFFDSADNMLNPSEAPKQISRSDSTNLWTWPEVSTFLRTDDFFSAWDQVSPTGVYGRILDQQGDSLPALDPGYLDVFPISQLATQEEFPRVATFGDRFLATWEAGGDIYASLNTLDSHAPAIDTTLTYPAGAVLYDTLGTRSIPVATVVVDSGARIDAGLDQVTLTWEYHCPRGDSSYGSGPMNGTTDPDSFYFYLSNIDSPGTEIRYYIAATDSALNQNQFPVVPGDVRRVFIANLGDINVNSLIDPYDVAVLEDHVCLGQDLADHERVFADFNEDDTLTCVDVDSLRARAVEAFDPDTLASCGELPVDNRERVFIEIGVGGAIRGGSDGIPVYLDNDSVSVKGIHLEMQYDGSFLAVVDTSTTSRTGSLDMSPPCCPPPQSVPVGVESYNLVGLGPDSLPPGSGSILDLEVSVSGSTPDGSYHFTLTKDVLYGPDHEPVYTIPLRGKFFVPAPPPVSIVCTPIADTLLAPGDTLTFNTTLTNHSDSTSSPQFFVYGTTTGPDSFTFLAVDTTQILQLAPGGRKRDVTDLEVPGQAPVGHYVFTAHVVNPVKDTTLDTDSFGFGVSGPSKPGFGGGELARAGDGMRPWRVIRGWFGYLGREGQSEQDDITSPGLPRAFSLSQNYPNPFNPSTTIRYQVPAGERNPRVRIAVFDLRGRRIRQLLDEERTPGGYSVHWDGRDDRGREAPSGVYLYRIDAGDFISTRKMVLLR